MSMWKLIGWVMTTLHVHWWRNSLWTLTGTPIEQECRCGAHRRLRPRPYHGWESGEHPEGAKLRAEGRYAGQRGIYRQRGKLGMFEQ
jgi:hypothetical protein